MTDENQGNPFPYQQRMLEEKAELEGKIQKLSDFIADAAVDDETKADMDAQLTAMGEYLAALTRRIAVFQS